MKSMFAALLAIASTVALTTEAQSKGTYYIRSGAPAVLDAPTVLTEPAVIAPATTTLDAPTVLTEPAVIAPATTTTVLQGQPLLQQTLLMPAVISAPAGFTMDPAAMALYRGPRFENTLTMPDAATYLRP